MVINNLTEEIEKINNMFLENRNIEEEKQILKKYLKEDTLTKGMVDLFLEKIYIYDKDTIKIKWNFKKY